MLFVLIFRLEEIWALPKLISAFSEFRDLERDNIKNLDTITQKIREPEPSIPGGSTAVVVEGEDAKSALARLRKYFS